MKEDINNNIDNDFADINKNNLNKTYIIVGILYGVVIILLIFLILGLKNQRDVIDNNYNNKDDENIEIKEENKTDNNVEIEENKSDNKIDDDSGLNILDQIR